MQVLRNQACCWRDNVPGNASAGSLSVGIPLVLFRVQAIARVVPSVETIDYSYPCNIVMPAHEFLLLIPGNPALIAALRSQAAPVSATWLVMECTAALLRHRAAESDWCCRLVTSGRSTGRPPFNTTKPAGRIHRGVLLSPCLYIGSRQPWMNIHDRLHISKMYVLLNAQLCSMSQKRGVAAFLP